MAGDYQGMDAFAVGLTRWMIKLRLLVILAALAGTYYVGTNVTKLEFSNNYRAFFSPDNPELQTFEDFQAMYTKSDNFLFVLEPRDGSGAFTNNMLDAVEYMTEQAWLIPYALRVDSLSNFQYTYAIEDDLIVEDLYSGGANLSKEEIETVRQRAFSEPLVFGALVDPDGRSTAINVTLQLPEKSLTEVPEAVAAGRALRAEIEEKFPNIDVHLSGGSMLNNAFSEAVRTDLTSLIPAMFIVVLIATWVSVRSFSATASTLVIVILSTIIAMGFAGFIGIKLTGPSPSATVIILTLAIADSIHILISMRNAMKEGFEKKDAIVEAIRINFLPVAVTSITTMVGFLALNLSDSPPFRDLGTITAVGIMCAWLLSITLLPALLSLAPIKVAARDSIDERRTAMTVFADVVIRHSRLLFLVVGAGAVVLISYIPSVELNDDSADILISAWNSGLSLTNRSNFLDFIQLKFRSPLPAQAVSANRNTSKIGRLYAVASQLPGCHSRLFHHRYHEAAEQKHEWG